MPCYRPLTVRVHNYVLANGSVGNTASVPCGRCLVCRKNKVDEWSFRLRQEQLEADSAHFVTLTYAPENLVYSDNGHPTLCGPDLTKYFKRLRDWMKADKVDYGPFKYYAVGEYGEDLSRPHYHLIALNATVDHIIEAWCVSGRHTSRYKCNYNAIGHVHIGKVNTDSIAYCVKYLDKGRKVPAFAGDDRRPEFSRMSKGLGQRYLTPEMIAWHKADVNRNYIQDGLFKIALPKYYRQQIYNSTEQEAQRLLINEKKLILEADDQKTYFKEYPHNTLADWYLYKEYQKLTQDQKLKNGKKRKI